MIVFRALEFFNRGSFVRETMSVFMGVRHDRDFCSKTCCFFFVNTTHYHACNLQRVDYTEVSAYMHLLLVINRVQSRHNCLQCPWLLL